MIPSRMGSTRFPGKALATIYGIPMIGHVYFRSKMSKLLDDVYILTPSKEIMDYADSIGAKWIKDGKKEYRGCSNATADATIEIEKRTGKKIDVAVMIQGDEPMIVPKMIDMATKPMLKDSSINVVNLMAPIRSEEEHNDPNCPKVVVDVNNFALYFSREPIPSKKKWAGGSYPKYKQVCIMPFARDFLIKFSKMRPTPMELVESIDMNRALEHGYGVKMVLENEETYCVDTPDDLKRVERHMNDDRLIEKYAPKKSS